ncbi:MAG: hypothetical protein QXV17_10705 [Candidatus Micrarchaeaceae archaeon]
MIVENHINYLYVIYEDFVMMFSKKERSKDFNSYIDSIGTAYIPWNVIFDILTAKDTFEMSLAANYSDDTKRVYEVNIERRGGVTYIWFSYNGKKLRFFTRKNIDTDTIMNNINKFCEAKYLNTS